MEKRVEELLSLMRVDSASGEEREIADILIEKLRDLGFTVIEDDAGRTFGGNCGNVYGVLEGELKGSLLFTSHMDRVSNGFGISPVVKGDMIYSDGTTILAADDLSGVAAILNGIRKVLKSGQPHPRLEVLYTVGEEKRLCGSAAFQTSLIHSRIAFALDSPGKVGRLLTSAPGRAVVKVEVFGKQAHAGNCPEQGINAVKVLSRILAEQPDGRIDGETTANFALLSTGNPSLNVVQDYAVAQGEARSRDGKKLQAWLDELKTRAAEQEKCSGAQVKVDIDMQFLPFALPDDCRPVELAKKAMERLGREPVVEGSGGGMDANNLNAKGIPCIGVACGYANNHTTRENQSIPDFLALGDWVAEVIGVYSETL